MAKRKARVLGEWRERALCIGEETNLFFPERSQTEAAKAKAICHRCSVREECLTEAIFNRERHGVWGGMDTTERKVEMKKRRAAAKAKAEKSVS